jgi:hypothetical protein
MDRFKQTERLAAATRGEIPKVAVRWLAAARDPLERLTMAALDPDLTDEAFLALVEKFSNSLPGLLDTMDHAALANLMEEGMGAAMANGIAGRAAPPGPPMKAKLPWETDAWLAGNKNHDSKDGRFSRNPGGSLNLRGAKWEGSRDEMKKRAAVAMKGFPTLSHPESGMEMKPSREGIRKSLFAMRHPHEFMAAARMPEIFLHSSKAGSSPDRKGRREIKSFHTFEAAISFGKSRYRAEIITREIHGKDELKFYQLRLHPEKK